MKRTDASEDSFFNDAFSASGGSANAARVSVRAARALRFAEQLRAEGEILHGASANGKKIARSFWGASWCRNIESYQDYESRLPMGRSSLKNGEVIHLEIRRGEVAALVSDCELQHPLVRIDEIETEQLQKLRRRCAGSLHSFADLLRGDLSEETLRAFCDQENGLFPRPGEIHFSCDCWDHSVLCRHAAALLYAVAARLDEEPELFFLLRGIDASDFFRTGEAGDELLAVDPASGSVDGEPVEAFQGTAAELEALFGIEFESDSDPRGMNNGEGGHGAASPSAETDNGVSPSGRAES